MIRRFLKKPWKEISHIGKGRNQKIDLFLPLILVPQDVPELPHSLGAEIKHLKELLAIPHGKQLFLHEKDAQRTGVCPLKPWGLSSSDTESQRVLLPTLWQPEYRNEMQVFTIWD